MCVAVAIRLVVVVVVVVVVAFGLFVVCCDVWLGCVDDVCSRSFVDCVVGVVVACCCVRVLERSTRACVLMLSWVLLGFHSVSCCIGSFDRDRLMPTHQVIEHSGSILVALRFRC